MCDPETIEMSLDVGRGVGVELGDSVCGGCMKLIVKRGFVIVVLLALTASASGETWYVKAGAPGAAGTPWANAFNELQPALDAAKNSVGDDTIWVAEGTYYPTRTHGIVDAGAANEDRYVHFRLQNGVTLLGGFAGTETSADQRDVSAHETILSGDIGTRDDISDNCYHVFYHPDSLELDDTAVLDGFTVTGGNADLDVYPHNCGGGDDESKLLFTHTEDLYV